MWFVLILNNFVLQQWKMRILSSCHFLTMVEKMHSLLSMMVTAVRVNNIIDQSGSDIGSSYFQVAQSQNTPASMFISDY